MSSESCARLHRESTTLSVRSATWRALSGRTQLSGIVRCCWGPANKDSDSLSLSCTLSMQKNFLIYNRTFRPILIFSSAVCASIGDDRRANFRLPSVCEACRQLGVVLFAAPQRSPTFPAPQRRTGRDDQRCNIARPRTGGCTTTTTTTLPIRGLLLHDAPKKHTSASAPRADTRPSALTPDLQHPARVLPSPILPAGCRWQRAR